MFPLATIIALLAVSLTTCCCCAAEGAVFDNRSPAFSQAGFEVREYPKAHDGSFVIAAKLPAGARARFEPGLAGDYDVYLHWPDLPDADSNAPWTVHHTCGSTMQRFNQRHNPGWHFHGSYRLDARSFIELAGPSRVYGPAVADAVKLVPTARRIVKRAAKDTITPVTLNHDDELHFQLRDGQTRIIKLVSTQAAIAEGTQQNVRKYTFSAVLTVDGERHEIQRAVPCQESFYEPAEIRGVRIWLDAVSCIFKDDGGFMGEKDVRGGGPSCRPARKARLAVNDVHDRVCPERLVWWYPETAERIDVRRCYRGEDVWMGPYEGKGAHGGLDINMKSGTPLYAPIAFDEHGLFNSLREGDNNNRWRGVRRWENGSVWWLQAHHLNKMVVAEHTPLKAGTLYAETAGVHIGAAQHTHFVFRVFEEGESYFLDPWIVFWQTFRDNPKAP